ncbi:MAG: flagellar basal body-associated protein FliL [Gammaproteobacteria bacterium]|nr:MAG: flagellar basal body-associated protein FliL [Gammaproteobacteria bacterium]
MADEDLSLDDKDEDATEGSEENASSGGKKKLIIIIAVAVVLLIGGGAAAYFLIFAESDEATTPITEVDGISEEGVAKAVDKPPKKIVVPDKGEAIYISIPDPFLVNIKSGKRSRMMQIKVQFLVRSNEAEDLVKQHMPLIRNDMLDFFSLADADEVRTREGRNALKQGALETAQQVMKDQVGYEAIELVLFTGFVVQ